MVLSKTYPQTRRDQGGVAEGLYNRIKEVDDKIAEVEAGTVPAGSISTSEIADLAVTEGKIAATAVTTAKIANLNITEGLIATGAVTSGKIADSSVTSAKLRGDMKYHTSAGVTITALTAAFGDPATLPDGFLGFIKDTTDSNHIRAVTVIGGAFYYGGVYTAAV